jgi:hypothetical protein
MLFSSVTPSVFEGHTLTDTISHPEPQLPHSMRLIQVWRAAKGRDTTNCLASEAPTEDLQDMQLHMP